MHAARAASVQPVCTNAARPSTTKPHMHAACQAPSKHHQGHHHHHHRCQPRKKKFLNFEVKFGMQIKKNERNAGEEESGDLEL
jgi:hypothetical protein